MFLFSFSFFIYMSVIYTDVCFVNLAAEVILLIHCCGVQREEDEAALWPGVLFVQDVIMARSIEKEDAWVAAFRKDVVIDCSSLSSIHVLHQDGYVQGLG